MIPGAPLQNHEEENYFKVLGEIYLYVEDYPDSENIHLSQGLPESGDPIELRLMNFQARLLYNNPEHSKDLIELARILEMIHKAKDLTKLPQVRLQSVLISAGDLEYLSHEYLPVGKRVLSHMSFPDYPYESISVAAEVIHCQLARHPKPLYEVALGFQEIPENYREMIIKFVNQIQRRK